MIPNDTQWLGAHPHECPPVPRRSCTLAPLAMRRRFRFSSPRSPRTSRRRKDENAKKKMKKKKKSMESLEDRITSLSHDSEISVTISDFNIAGKWQRLRVSVCKGSKMLKVETCRDCSPPLFPTYSKQKGVPSMVFSCFPNVPRDLHGSSGIGCCKDDRSVLQGSDLLHLPLAQ